MIEKFRELAAVVEAELADNEAVLQFQPIGSAIYHPDAKDVDFLVLIAPESIGDVLQLFSGWEPCGSYDGAADWYSMRRDDANLIITADANWFNLAVRANAVCVALKVMDKVDRKKVYRIVRDGVLNPVIEPEPVYEEIEPVDLLEAL